jgi:hypothetical protein
MEASEGKRSPHQEAVKAWRITRLTPEQIAANKAAEEENAEWEARKIAEQARGKIEENDYFPNELIN